MLNDIIVILAIFGSILAVFAFFACALSSQISNREEQLFIEKLLKEEIPR